MLARQLGPEAKDSEVVPANIGVVEKNNGIPRQFRPPAFVVVLHRFVSVQPVNMQEVDAAVREEAQAFVERHSVERREPVVSGVVVLAKLLEDSAGIEAGMHVALPGVDGVATAIEISGLNCLTEGRIGKAGMRDKLNACPP